MLRARYAAILIIAVMVVSAAAVMASDGSDGASGYTARVFVGDGTEGGSDELSGSGKDVEGILADALGSRIVMNANGTVKSLDGKENTDKKSWQILQWRPPTGWVTVLANSSGDAYLESGTSYYVYYSDVTKGTDGKTRYSTPSSFEPVSTGYFYIKFVTDANANDYARSILTEAERLNGFWIKGEGSDIAEAFMDACSELRSRGNPGFQLEINDDPNNELYGWLGSFIGLEDDDSPGGGLWNNWSQFAWNPDTGKWEYNNWCLGYYDPGVYPYFSVVRQITADDSASAGVGATPSDIPSCVKKDSCTVRFVDGNGSVLKTQSVPYFGSATAPSNPTKAPSGGSTYQFTGWDRGFDQVVSDITVTAQFRELGTASVTGVKVSPAETTLAIGGTRTLSATVSPSDAANIDVRWSSSDTSVATVDSSGRVKALSAGTVIITAKTVDGGFEASCSLTVSPPAGSVTQIEIGLGYIALGTGDVHQLDAVVGPSSVTDRSVTWSSSDTSVVKVDSKGAITAVAPGSATVTVKANNGGLTASCLVAVMEDSGSGSSISVDVPDNGGDSYSSKVNVEKVAGSDVDLTVKTGLGSITITDKALVHLGGDSDLTVSVSKYAQSGLQPGQRAVIESLGSDVVIFQYQINGSDGLGLGGDVIVRMPYTLSDGEDAGDISVYCLSTSGSVEAFGCDYSEDEFGQGYVTFTTTHFSLYFATSEDVGSAGPSDDGSEGGSDIVMYAGIAAAVVAILLVAVVAMRRRA